MNPNTTEHSTAPLRVDDALSLGRLVRRAPKSDFSLLEAISGDCAGALVILPPDQQPQRERLGAAAAAPTHSAAVPPSAAVVSKQRNAC